MPSVLLDEGVPVGIRAHLKGFTVVTTAVQGWAGLANGRLIAAAEAAGFDSITTTDQNWPYQVNTGGLRVALIVLETTNWYVIRGEIERVIDAVDAATPGSYASIPFSRPSLRRRPPPI